MRPLAVRSAVLWLLGLLVAGPTPAALAAPEGTLTSSCTSSSCLFVLTQPYRPHRGLSRTASRLAMRENTERTRGVEPLDGLAPEERSPRIPQDLGGLRWLRGPATTCRQTR